MAHQNTAHGINSITIKSSIEDLDVLRSHLESVFGQATEITHGFSIETPNGHVRVLLDSELSNIIGELPQEVMNDKQPSIVAMEFLVEDMATTLEFIKASGMPHQLTDSGIVLSDASLLGNTLFQFHEAIKSDT